MSAAKRYYQILELEPGASRQEIKRAFRAMAKTYHPDLYPYDDVSRQSCVRRMQQINEAYEFLRDIAPDEPAPDAAAPPPEYDEPEPDLAARYGRDAAAEEEPWAEPEPVDEAEPGITRFDEEFAKEAELRRRPHEWSPFRHGMPADEPDFAGLFQLGASYLLAIITLALFYFIDVTIFKGYFSAMRVVVCLVCAHSVYFALCRGYWEVAMASAVLGAALNPAVPLMMDLEGWWLFNMLCPVMLVFFWILMLNRESDKILGIRRRS
ncbi:MAG: J domain-containing protein [Elusimicrobiota bacterium]